MKGVNPEWLALPKRSCDNCGTKYKPKQPLRPGQKHGFCKPNCKKEFHKNSGAYRKLKVEMEKLIDKRLRELVRDELERLLPRCEVDVLGRVYAGEHELYGRIRLPED